MPVASVHIIPTQPSVPTKDCDLCAKMHVECRRIKNAWQSQLAKLPDEHAVVLPVGGGACCPCCIYNSDLCQDPHSSWAWVAVQATKASGNKGSWEEVHAEQTKVPKDQEAGSLRGGEAVKSEPLRCLEATATCSDVLTNFTYKIQFKNCLVNLRWQPQNIDL